MGIGTGWEKELPMWMGTQMGRGSTSAAATGRGIATRKVRETAVGRGMGKMKAMWRGKGTTEERVTKTVKERELTGSLGRIQVQGMDSNILRQTPGTQTSPGTWRTRSLESQAMGMGRGIPGPGPKTERGTGMGMGMG
jgi:hypothetical protein